MIWRRYCTAFFSPYYSYYSRERRSRFRGIGTSHAHTQEAYLKRVAKQDQPITHQEPNVQGHKQIMTRSFSQQQQTDNILAHLQQWTHIAPYGHQEGCENRCEAEMQGCQKNGRSPAKDHGGLLKGCRVQPKNLYFSDAQHNTEPSRGWESV